MMENRLKKLLKEEDKLKLQINTADKHSVFADKVQARRSSEMETRNKYAHLIEESRERSKMIFNARR